MEGQNPKTTVLQGTPFPAYLVPAEAKAVIYAIEEAGFQVQLTSPAPGSVCVTIIAPDGNRRSEIGRPEDLENAVCQVAKLVGLGFEDE